MPKRVITADLSNLRKVELGDENVAFNIEMGGPEKEEVGLTNDGITFWPSVGDFHYHLTWEEFLTKFPTIASKTFA